jgi:DtxR family Mn-dependent transcriptional regulator
MVTKSVEDYLEAIYRLIKEKGYARPIDIAQKLQVKQPSATEMIQRLAKSELVSYEKYRGLSLTPKGKKIAKSIYQRHKTLTEFLKILGVKEKIAEQDACKIEHDVNPQTMKHMLKFVEFVQKSPKKPEWLEHFEYYIRTGERLECEKRKKRSCD